MIGINGVDKRLTNTASFTSFRKQCLNSRMIKNWVSNADEKPECTGLYFIKHKDFLGEIDIAQFYINSKGKSYWLTAGEPTAWSEIETYDYILEDGQPLHQEE